METPTIAGIAFNRDEAKLTILGVPDMPGVAHHILGPIGEGPSTDHEFHEAEPAIDKLILRVDESGPMVLREIAIATLVIGR